MWESEKKIFCPVLLVDDINVSISFLSIEKCTNKSKKKLRSGLSLVKKEDVQQ